jgi:CRP-like cAMP-binding protein
MLATATLASVEGLLHALTQLGSDDRAALADDMEAVASLGRIGALAEVLKAQMSISGEKPLKFETEQAETITTLLTVDTSVGVTVHPVLQYSSKVVPTDEPPTPPLELLVLEEPLSAVPMIGGHFSRKQSHELQAATSLAAHEKHATLLVVDEQNALAKAESDGRPLLRKKYDVWSAKKRSKLTSAEEALAATAFSSIDVNDDGTLSPEEIFSVLSCLGIKPTVQELYALLREFDGDNDGTLGYPEFLQLLGTVKMRMSAEGSKKNMEVTLKSMTDLMKTVYSQNLEGDYIGNSPYILHPNHPVQGVWDLLISILLGITMITIPMTLGFEGFSEALLPANLCMDCIFLLDVVKNFNSGVVNSDDVVILDRKMIAKQYIRTWFFLDLISSIPLEIFFLGGGDDADAARRLLNDSTQYTRTTKSMKLLRLLKLAKLFRLLKVNRVFVVVRKITQYLSDGVGVTVQLKATTNLFRLLMQVLLIAHWIGCLNFMLCRLYDFPAESWVERMGIRHSSNAVQWSWSFYKALSYMISVGIDSGGVTDNCMEYRESLGFEVRMDTNWCEVENWNVLICLYIGAVFCALLVSEVSSIIINLNQKGLAIQNLLHKANDYMRVKRLPVATRDKVRNYLYSEYITDNMIYNEEELLDMLPETLVTEILTFNTRDVVEACPLLKEHSPSFQSGICGAIKPYIGFQGDAIFEQNTTGHEIFFVHSGVIQIISEKFRENNFQSKYRVTDGGARGGVGAGEDGEEDCEKAIVAVLSNGCYFGDVGLFFDIKRTATAQCATLSNLFSIDQQSLFKLLDDFPEERAYMIDVASSRLKRVNEFNTREDDDQGRDMTYVDEEDKKTELLGIAHMLGKYQDSVGSDGQPVPVVIKKKKSTGGSAPVGDRNRRASTMGGANGKIGGRKLSNAAYSSSPGGGRGGSTPGGGRGGNRTASQEFNRTASQEFGIVGLGGGQTEVKTTSRYGSADYGGGRTPQGTDSPRNQKDTFTEASARQGKRRESMRAALDKLGPASPFVKPAVVSSSSTSSRTSVSVSPSTVSAAQQASPDGAESTPASRNRHLRIRQEARSEFRRQSRG